MANFFDGLVNLAKHPLDEAQFLFDVGRGKIDLKDAPGKHQEMMNDITVPLGGHNKLTENSDAAAAAIVASFFAAPVIGGAMGGSGSSSLGGSEFATGSFGGNKFGSMDFGSGPSFSGGAPNVPEFGMTPGGTTATGGWGQTTNWGEIASSNQSGKNAQAMADIFKSVGNALNQMDGGSGSGGSGKAKAVSFKGAKMPAQQFDSGAMHNQMAAQQFQDLAMKGDNLNIPGKKDLNALLGLA